jgi:hypothetical protein
VVNIEIGCIRHAKKKIELMSPKIPLTWGVDSKHPASNCILMKIGWRRFDGELKSALAELLQVKPLGMDWCQESL